MTVRINKQKINLREKLAEFEDRVNFDEVVRGLGEYTGNVGIGTTSPSANLEIKGGSEPFAIYDANDEKKLRTYTQSNGTVLALTDGGNDIIRLDGRTGSPNDSYFNGGNVGIGTTSPGYNLHIAGGTPALKLEGTQPRIWLSETDQTDLNTLIRNNNSRFQIDTASDSDGVIANRLIILNTNGNVGIGVTSPSVKLDIVGSSGTGGIKYTSGTGSDVLALDIGYTGGGTGLVVKNTNGNVGIGTTSPSQKFHVYAQSPNTYAARIDNTASTNANGLLIDHRNNAADNNSTFFLTCQDSAAVRLRIYSDGDVWTSDSGTLTSDEQLKTNIVDATPKLEDIKKLKVRNFEWIPEFHPAKVGEKKIGFIAQELEQVFPGLVDEHNMILGEEEISRKSVRLGALIPILVKGMQEQQSIIEDLKSRIETLESK